MVVTFTKQTPFQDITLMEFGGMILISRGWLAAFMLKAQAQVKVIYLKYYKIK